MTWAFAANFTTICDFWNVAFKRVARFLQVAQVDCDLDELKNKNWLKKQQILIYLNQWTVFTWHKIFERARPTSQQDVCVLSHRVFHFTLRHLQVIHEFKTAFQILFCLLENFRHKTGIGHLTWILFLKSWFTKLMFSLSSWVVGFFNFLR